MPKLPVVSGKQAITMLKALGFEEVRQRGSHVVLRRGGVGCVVPLHKALKSGTLIGILRQAGVTRDDFIAQL